MSNRILTDKLKNLRSRRAARDKAQEKADELADECRKLESELFAFMRDQDLTSAKVGGNQYVTATTVYAQVQDKQALIRWAQENDEELIALSPRKALLNQKARECLDNGEPLPPGMGVYEKEYISIRAS